ncbi:MAG: hypothetical protein DRO15_05940 [Thermoprotei archaeon]|nr:MAG: hypothetical protein DRO15_05940 [Thermoprotei archaeon]
MISYNYAIPIITILIITLPSLILVTLVIILIRSKSLNRVINQLSSLIIVKDNEILITKPILAEYGILNSVGYWTIGRRISSYRCKSYFKSILKPNYLNRIKVDEISNKYTILVDSDGCGVLILPCFKILDDYFKNIVIAIINPRTPNLEVSSNRLRIDYKGKDIVEAFIHISGSEIYGSIYRYMASRYRIARLELIGEAGTRGQYIIIHKLITESRSQKVEFRYKFAPNEPIVILTHEKVLTPMRLLKALRQKAPLILGLGAGKYKLRLSLETPIRKKVFTEVGIKYR